MRLKKVIFNSFFPVASWGEITPISRVKYPQLHPPKQTWNLKMDPWKRRFLLETIISRFHVNFLGCIHLFWAIYGAPCHPTYLLVGNHRVGWKFILFFFIIARLTRWQCRAGGWSGFLKVHPPQNEQMSPEAGGDFKKKGSSSNHYFSGDMIYFFGGVRIEIRFVIGWVYSVR